MTLTCYLSVSTILISAMPRDRPKLVSADMLAKMSVSVSVVQAETDITMHYLT